MQTTWIVLADAGRARILQRREAGVDLEEIEEITDAAAHAHNADFRHDAMGRRSPSSGHGGTGAAGTGTVQGSSTTSAGDEKLDHEEALFARRVAARLAEAHQQHKYDHLRIAAAPRFLGRLRQELAKDVRAVVDDEIDKDLLQLDRRALTQRFYGDGPGTRQPDADPTPQLRH